MYLRSVLRSVLRLHLRLYYLMLYRIVFKICFNTLYRIGMLKELARHESRMIGKKYKLEQKNIKKFGFEQKNEERNLEVEDISYCMTI